MAYVVPSDPEADALLLVDHRRSGLWLPAGGHVEPDEDPAAAACREAREELGLDTDVAALAPSFLTVTRTVGPPATRHVDVSLWYLVRRTSAWSPTLDEREFRGARWWTRPEVLEADPARFDPHLGRFLTKIGPPGL